MRFEFATATRIIFGAGSIADAAIEAARFGSRALVVTGGSAARSIRLFDDLRNRGVDIEHFPVNSEPTVAIIDAGTAAAKNSRCDMVIGIGGGSVIDTGKAIALLVANNSEVLDYIEVVGRGRTPENPSLPYIAIPTTAGTGAEVTRNAVIALPAYGIKASLRSPFMLPRLAIIDPQLTYSLPAGVTASTGLDALTQCIEALVSVKATPLTDGFSREGIERAARSLRTACSDGGNAAAREDMALASLLSGLALANAGLGAVHGFAAVIGGKCNAPHGVVCALLLPQVMEANIRALRMRGDGQTALERYASVARLLTGSLSASAEEGCKWVKSLCAGLPLPAPSSIGIARRRFPDIVTAARAASSMKGNPIELTETELTDVLERTFTDDTPGTT